MSSNFTPKPLSPEHGFGFFSFDPIGSDLINEEFLSNFRHEQIGRYHNYYFTKKAYIYPFFHNPKSMLMDGFSPNLNKELHIGHLRNLAVAASLQKITECNVTAMFGASQGVKTKALESLKKWTKIAKYKIKNPHYDNVLPDDALEGELEPGEDDAKGCLVWEGPYGPVIVERSDGRKTYSYHDLAFAKLVSPDFYLTGAEQTEHFCSLDLGNKHLPMGLVLGSDGKKMKSRSGDFLSADDALRAVVDNLEHTDHCEKLAWNILSWNFLSVGRKKNIKFNPNSWAKTEAPGMYISYTYARIESALKKQGKNTDNRLCWYSHLPEVQPEMIEEKDINLVGFSSYISYYLKDAEKNMDTSRMANFTLELAQRLTLAYHEEKIVKGREGFIWSINTAMRSLGRAMTYLNMYRLENI